jgi:phosphoribosylamine-glycine ligase
MVGVTIIRFQIPEDWPAGLIELRMRQGDVETNTVVLPLE